MLSVNGLSKTYESRDGPVKAIDSLDCEIAKGEFVCILGPSGAGKTTLLRCMAGLLPATSGTVAINGQVIDGPPRQLALVFQDYSRSLLPWLTVSGNIAMPLKNRGAAREEIQEATTGALNAVGLSGCERQYPWQLSGGMQQRVAIARALAYKPEVLLMDEPFASVDAQTRADLEDLVLKVQDEFKITTLFVTHDIDEAIYLSNRIIVLTPRPCRVRDIVQVALPKPRDQIATKQLPAFASMRSHILREIRGADPDRELQDKPVRDAAFTNPSISVED